MRRALPWLGLLLLTVCFVYLVRLPVPESTRRAATARKPIGPVEQTLVVVLDPGHGGDDSGAMCGNVMEKDLTLDVALRAELLLRTAGFTTVLTRDSDRYVSLAERASLSNRTEHSIFISIHFNDGAREAASGVETYYSPGQANGAAGFLSWLPFVSQPQNTQLTAASHGLASCLQGALVQRTQAVDRGIKQERFYVIANTGHPAVLVEGGFMTNKSDVTKLTTAEYRQDIATAVSEGVERYRATTHKSKSDLAIAAAQPE
ncbi:MAG TPA: N-acetylmuramoyl-L-alanine amidase [Chthoniobacterales bacterium]|jgi:N-acetylmuramoyl-L-alanine amidase